jgi:hypothetical protein
MEGRHALTARPPKKHGTNGELVVFEMMADIESLIRRKLGHSFMHECWPILQVLHRAHLVGRELRLSDVWVAADQPLSTTVDCLERLAMAGLVDCEPEVLERHEDGVVALTPAGAQRADSLAEGIVETVTRGLSRAGLDPFARHLVRRASDRDRPPEAVTLR